MSDTVLVTGAAGYVAQHVVRALTHGGRVVYGADLAGAQPPESLRGNCATWDCRDARATRLLLEMVRPSHVVHLAAVLPGASAEQCFSVNAAGTWNVYDSIAALGLPARVITLGSAAEYGFAGVASEGIHEACPLRPCGPYGASKAAQGLLALAAARQWSTPAVHLRVFNLIGPAQPVGSLPGDMARRVLGWPIMNTSDPFYVTNAAAFRDFVDVRDVATAVVLACSNDSPVGVVNICSGSAVSVGDFARRVARIADRSIRFVDKQTDTSQVVSWSVGSPELARDTLGWRPEIDLDTSIGDLLASFR